MINIRKAVKEDVISFVEFNAAMAFETENKVLDRDILTKAVTAVFDDARKGFYVVAESDNAVVGGLMITYEWSDWRNAWFWWIQSVYIMPDARGKGIYSLLYDFVKQMASKEDDVIGFRLYVELENTNAQAVYEKLGMSRSNYFMYDAKM